jgi:hypothetical protein
VITIPAHCPHCGEFYPSFSWDYSLQGKDGIVDGRHCINEIQVNVTLGCDACSETLIVMPLADFLAESKGVLSIKMRVNWKRTAPDTPVSPHLQQALDGEAAKVEHKLTRPDHG